MPAVLCKPLRPCDRPIVSRIETEEQAYAAGGGAAAEVVTVLASPLADELRWAVVRGCFDRAGSISAPDDTGEPVCVLSGDRRLVDAIEAETEAEAEAETETEAEAETEAASETEPDVPAPVRSP